MRANRRNACLLLLSLTQSDSHQYILATAMYSVIFQNTVIILLNQVFTPSIRPLFPSRQPLSSTARMIQHFMQWPHSLPFLKTVFSNICMYFMHDMFQGELKSACTELSKQLEAIRMSKHVVSLFITACIVKAQKGTFTPSQSSIYPQTC